MPIRLAERVVGSGLAVKSIRKRGVTLIFPDNTVVDLFDKEA